MVRCVLAIMVLLVGAAGCGGAAPDESGFLYEPDCVAYLAWEGVRYQSSGVENRLPLGERLGSGTIPGCGFPYGGENVRDYEVNVLRIREVSPSVAVGVEGENWQYAWLGPGYLPESPRHPLHDAIYGSPREPNAETDFRCGPARAIRARALTTPAFESVYLRITAEDAEIERLLLEDNLDRIVNLDANTVVRGHERDGIPFVQAGDEFSLLLRECEGKETGPGLAGLRRLVVKQLGP